MKRPALGGYPDLRAQRLECGDPAPLSDARPRPAEKRRRVAALQTLLTFAAALLASLSLSGCLGYHLGPAKPAFLKDVHSLNVPVFRNNTLLTNLEGVVTDTVIGQIQQDGTYQITNADNADAVLTCTIEKVQRTPDRSVTGNVLLTSEFDLDLGVRYVLSERATGKILDSGRIDGQTSFFVGNDVQQDERQAIPIAAQQLAVRLVSMITEGF